MKIAILAAAAALAGAGAWYLLAGGGAGPTPTTDLPTPETTGEGATPAPSSGNAPAAGDPTPTLPPRPAAPGDDPMPSPDHEADPDRVFARGAENSHGQDYAVELVDGKPRWHIGPMPPPEDAAALEATLEVASKLGSTTIASVRWKDVPVSDAAAELSRATGIAFEASDDAGALPVRVVLKDTTAHEALTFLCRSAQVAFEVTNGRVRILRAPNPHAAPAEKAR